jgi:hypothetical protein
MSTIFNKLRSHAQQLDQMLSSQAFLIPQTHDYAWNTRSYTNAWFRRANLDIVDATETKKLYMMHLCVFPHTYDSAPIYGFDIIAGTNKVTGAFLDFSPIGTHPLNQWFREFVEPTSWSKPRELPTWAQKIFSPHMVAAGNINSEFELDLVLELSKKSLQHYLQGIPRNRPNLTYDEQVAQFDYTSQQNFYCQQQKQNPHTPRVLNSLGFTEAEVYDYIHHELFPELA